MEKKLSHWRLRGRLIKEFGTLTRVAELMNIKPFSFGMRINGKIDFKDSEIMKLSKIMGISKEEIPMYFFEEL